MDAEDTSRNGYVETQSRGFQYPLPTLQVVRYRTRMQGSLPVGG